LNIANELKLKTQLQNKIKNKSVDVDKNFIGSIGLGSLNTSLSSSMSYYWNKKESERQRPPDPAKNMECEWQEMEHTLICQNRLKGFKSHLDYGDEGTIVQKIQNKFEIDSNMSNTPEKKTIPCEPCKSETTPCEPCKSEGLTASATQTTQEVIKEPETPAATELQTTQEVIKEPEKPAAPEQQTTQEVINDLETPAAAPELQTTQEVIKESEKEIGTIAELVPQTTKENIKESEITAAPELQTTQEVIKESEIPSVPEP